MKNTAFAALVSLSLLSGCASDGNLDLPKTNYTNKQLATAEAVEVAERLANSPMTAIDTYYQLFHYDKEAQLLSEVIKLKRNHYKWTLYRAKVNEQALENVCSSGFRPVIDGGVAYRVVYLGTGGLSSDVIDSSACGKYDKAKK